MENKYEVEQMWLFLNKIGLGNLDREEISNDSIKQVFNEASKQGIDIVQILPTYHPSTGLLYSFVVYTEID